MRKELCLVLILGIMGCGENEDTTSPSSQAPPGNLKALSVNNRSVGLQWTAPTAPPDSLGGYVVQVGTRKDTLAKTTVSFLADSLTTGEKTFTVYALHKSGTLSDGAVIKWAPAARFDTPYVLYEYRTNVTTVNSAFDVGTATLDPAGMGVTSANATRMDLYLFGGNGSVAEALQLQSTHLLASVWNSTMFSTVSSPSSGLDCYLAEFPASSTFTLDRVSVVDNTIYYVRAIGDNGNGNYNYARIHVHMQAGSVFPSRAVELRVSLQRVVGLLYALRRETSEKPRALLGLITLPGVRG
jgi:hypothetical protein